MRSWVPSPPESYSPPTPYATERALGTGLLRPPPSSHRSTSSRDRPAQNVRFDEAQIAMAAADSAGRAPMREMSQSNGGHVTPGLDETPFIQYALDALTRDDSAALAQSLPSSEPSSNTPVGAAPQAPQSPAATQPRSVPSTPYNPLSLPAFNAETPSISSDEDNYVPTSRGQPRPSGSTKRVAVPYSEIERSQGTGPGMMYGAPNYKPVILRPASFITLIVLCILMIAALIFCGAYSKQQSGLTPFLGTMSGGHFFLFRILPALLGAVLLVYAQAVIVTTFRILPFERMHSDNPRDRHGAVFLDLSPRSLLWPHLVGPLPVKACIFATWLLNFTLPLLSALFGIAYVEGEWTWATVQGVVWTLVALYAIYLAALTALAWFWLRRATGMLWDVRSIADVIPLLHHSNARASYKGTETAPSRRDLEERLQDRMEDRLGYWQFERTETTQVASYWWGIGAPGAEQDDRAVPRAVKKEPYSAVSDMEALTPEARHRYLPWALRSGPLLISVAAGAALVVALLAVSLHPDTRLASGFAPMVPAGPDNDAFSPANFLYSFIPALLGMMLFLAFQSLDMTYRRLMPWGELSDPEGATARQSILLDYTACLPLQVVYKALKRGHYRLALVSTLSTLLVFLPVLAGAIFMAMTISGTRTVRMFPSMPVYGVVLALLGLLTVGLAVMLPGRNRFRLPHGVGCLAEVFSFVAGDEVAGSDPAFRFPRYRVEMLGGLGVGMGGGESRWWFGVGAGREEAVGVRRVRRFTERGARRGGSRDGMI